MTFTLVKSRKGKDAADHLAAGSSIEDAIKLDVGEFLADVDPDGDSGGDGGTGRAGAEAGDEEGLGGIRSTFGWTDTGNAERLAAMFRNRLRFVADRDHWLTWTGKVWMPNAELAAQSATKAVARAVRREAAASGSKDFRKFAASTESRRSREAMVVLARSETGLAIRASELDQHPFSLNVLNGTIDLRTGELRPHDPAELLTKLVPVAFDPAARAPRWERFLREVQPDAAVREFLQRAVGYSTTGIVREHLMFILVGEGRNGKSTFIEAILSVLGQDFCIAASPLLILAESHRDEEREKIKLTLEGRRFVVLQEINTRQSLSEATVKQLTGGDMMTARKMYVGPVNFAPTHHLWLAVNHLPVIRDSNVAIWERLSVIPFSVRFAMDPTDTTTGQANKKLLEALKAEAEGILAWAVEGAVKYYRDGLGIPDAVRRASAVYREAQDLFGRFFDDCVLFDSRLWTSTKDLVFELHEWCSLEGDEAPKTGELRAALRARGCEARKSSSRPQRRGWQGVGLRSDRDEPPGGSDDEPPTGGGARAAAPQPAPGASDDPVARPSTTGPEPDSSRVANSRASQATGGHSPSASNPLRTSNAADGVDAVDGSPTPSSLNASSASTAELGEKEEGGKRPSTPSTASTPAAQVPSPASTPRTEPPAVALVPARPCGFEVAYDFATTLDDARRSLAACLEACDRGETVGVDFETTPAAANLKSEPERKAAGLDPLLARPRLLQVARDGAPVVVVDLDKVGGLRAVGDLVARLGGVAHNAVFEMKFARQHGGAAPLLGCTLLAEHVLSGHAAPLADLAERYLHVEVPKEQQVSDFGQADLADAQLLYAARDAEAVRRLFPILERKLRETRSTEAYQRAVEAQPAMVTAQLTGVPFDRDAHARLMEDLAREQDAFALRLRDAEPSLANASDAALREYLEAQLSPDALRAWPRSPTDLLSVPRDVVADNLFRMPAGVQRLLRDVVIPLRDVKALLSRTGSTLSAFIHPVTGRIHPSMWLLGAETGRMSCSQPNLQGVSRDPRVRSVFAASPGRVLVVGDFGQLDMRVTAEIARDRELRRIFAAGEDVHLLTAARVLGKRADTVVAAERSLAKAVNFGLLYGQGSEGLRRYAARAYGVVMTSADAASYRQRWLAEFSGVRAWHARVSDELKSNSIVNTPSGRRRDVGPSGFTKATNTPVQGGAAEVVLATLAFLTDAIRKAGLDAKPVLFVHDEIHLDVAEGDGQRAADVLREAMVAGMRRIFPHAPTTGVANVKTCRSWGDAK